MFSLLDLLLGQLDEVLGGNSLFAVELTPFPLVLFSEGDRYPRHFVGLFLAGLAVAAADEIACAGPWLKFAPDIVSSILFISRERVDHVLELGCSFLNSMSQSANKVALI